MQPPARGIHCAFYAAQRNTLFVYTLPSGCPMKHTTTCSHLIRSIISLLLINFSIYWYSLLVYSLSSTRSAPTRRIPYFILTNDREYFHRCSRPPERPTNRTEPANFFIYFFSIPRINPIVFAIPSVMYCWRLWSSSRAQCNSCQVYWPFPPINHSDLWHTSEYQRKRERFEQTTTTHCPLFFFSHPYSYHLLFRLLFFDYIYSLLLLLLLLSLILFF